MLTAALARSLAMLLQSGRALLPALQAARDGLPSHFMRDQVGRAADAVHHGQRLHTALAALLPPLATELLTIGEESGELDAACARVADMYDDEVTRTLDLVTSLVAPALILFFGVLVGLIAMAMLQAVYGMNAGIL
jgi:type II secretory pathway component PulF